MKIEKLYGKYGGYLEHKIYENPYKTTKEEVIDYPKDYIRVDDKFYIDNNDVTGYIYVYIGLTILLMFGLTYALLYESHEPFFPFGWLLIITILVGGSFIIYHYTRPKKHLILNRMEGIITIPNFFYGKPYVMAFSDALAAWSVKNSTTNPLPPSLSLFHPDGFKSTDVLLGVTVLQGWSFIVWYMDKNRPLPSGDAFDEFRQADYERRKSEGFPKPLYPSAIDTPEHTPEQQKEREKIGGW